MQRNIFGSKREDATKKGRNCFMESFVVVPLNKYNLPDQVSEAEMGRECGTRGENASRSLVAKCEFSRDL